MAKVWFITATSKGFGRIWAEAALEWGLEGFSQALAGEVAGFGINVTIVEPTGYDTDWGGPSAVTADRIPAYEPVAGAVRAAFAAAGNAEAIRRRPGPRSSRSSMPRTRPCASSSAKVRSG